MQYLISLLEFILFFFYLLFNTSPLSPRPCLEALTIHGGGDKGRQGGIDNFILYFILSKMRFSI